VITGQEQIITRTETRQKQDKTGQKYNRNRTKQDKTGQNRSETGRKQARTGQKLDGNRPETGRSYEEAGPDGT
jgi:hypothetical protein